MLIKGLDGNNYLASSESLFRILLVVLAFCDLLCLDLVAILFSK